MSDMADDEQMTESEEAAYIRGQQALIRSLRHTLNTHDPDVYDPQPEDCSSELDAVEAEVRHEREVMP